MRSGAEDANEPPADEGHPFVRTSKTSRPCVHGLLYLQSSSLEIPHSVLHRAAATRRRRKNPHNSGLFHDQWPCRRMLEQSAGTPPSTVADQAMPIGKADHR